MGVTSDVARGPPAPGDGRLGPVAVARPTGGGAPTTPQ
jgi:hypothetical protein